MCKDESLTNRRDVDSKFNFLIPLEIFALRLRRQFADTHTLLHGVTLVSLQCWAGRICFTRRFGATIS